MKRINIETGIGSMIQTVADQVVKSAGLALLRGPAGIGKTFALDKVVEALQADGVQVVRVTASPAIGGSVSAFTRTILSEYRIETTSTSDGIEALADLLSGYPFRAYGPRVLFMADEAQELKPSILETVRGLWDRGTNARLSQEDGPAFGCMFVGNDLFMGKGGNLRVASFRPLLTRVTHNLSLPRPSKDEHAALAKALFPEQPEFQETLAGFGVDEGTLRAQDTAARQAKMLADGGQVSEAPLRQAIKMMGGKV